MKLRKWILWAVALLLIGGILFASAMFALGWDFLQLSTPHETNTHEISDPFTDISIETETAEITFLPAVDGKVTVVCKENEKFRHQVQVENGTLTVRRTQSGDWRDYISFFSERTSVTVYLPDTQYGNLTISEDTGDIRIPGDFRFEGIAIALSTGKVLCSASAVQDIRITATTGHIQVENANSNHLLLCATTGNISVTGVTCQGGVQVDVTTGEVTLTDVRCAELSSTGDTGDITLKSVIATGKFTIERDTGDVTFRNSDAAELSVTTDTGDVTGSLLTAKVFVTKTDTGRISLPGTTTGGKCEITTDTGNIKITIAP